MGTFYLKIEINVHYCLVQALLYRTWIILCNWKKHFLFQQACWSTALFPWFIVIKVLPYFIPSVSDDWRNFYNSYNYTVTVTIMTFDLCLSLYLSKDDIFTMLCHMVWSVTSVCRLIRNLIRGLGGDPRFLGLVWQTSWLGNF